jgi:hypothetical protein
MAIKGVVKVPPASGGFNFGDMSAYSSGGGIPEGDYVWKELTVEMFQPTKLSGATVGPAKLAVRIVLAPLGGGEDREQHYSLGTNAHQSWQPNPETGKSIVAVPGGPGTPPNASTNWAMLVKSLFDSGLPNGVLQDDLSVLEGIHVHMANVPEPEDRKGFRAKTGEASEIQAPGTIAVVTEIKDDGKPWEGTGGVPAETAPKPNGKVPHGTGQTAAPAAATRPATSRGATATTPAAPAVAEDTETAAITGISSVLELPQYAKGVGKLILRTSTFKSVSSTSGQEVAQKVINTYFSSDDSLNSILNSLGYKVAGPQVVPA